MTSKEAKSVSVPIWLMTVITAAMFAVCGDMWRKVNTIESDLRVMRAALITSGVLDPKVVKAQNCGILASNDGNSANQVFQERNL